jgi:hypothetical protein
MVLFAFSPGRPVECGMLKLNCEKSSVWSMLTRRPLSVREKPPPELLSPTAPLKGVETATAAVNGVDIVGRPAPAC